RIHFTGEMSFVGDGTRSEWPTRLEESMVPGRGLRASDDDEHEFGRAVVGVGQLVRHIAGRLRAVTGVQRGAPVDGDDLDAAGQDEEALSGTAAMRGEGRGLAVRIESVVDDVHVLDRRGQVA